MAKRKPLSDQLRDAIRGCGETVYRVAKDCEIAEPHLHYFLKRKVGLGLDNIDRLGDYLGLELRRTRKTVRREKA